MKKTLKMFSIAAVLLLAIALLPTQAQADAAEVVTSGTCGDNLTWVLTDDGVLTISGWGEMWDYEWYGNSPWEGEEFVTLVIEEGVTYIGAYTFSGSDDLVQIHIPGSVRTIGEGAFNSCHKLTSVTIPDGVAGIGKNAFGNCGSLASVTIADSVLKIESYAFSSCPELLNTYDNGVYVPNGDNPYWALVDTTNEYITSCVIHENTRIITDGAFSYCDDLESITIPDSVKIIGAAEIDAKITLGNGVIHIAQNAFGYKTEYTSFDNANYLGTKDNPYHAVVGCDYNIAGCTIHPDTKVIAGSAFDYSELEHVTIPEGVVTIGEEAFGWCRSLTEIVIPDSVTYIGAEAFHVCENLKSLTLSANLKVIGDSAFGYCKQLTSVTVPDSVTRLGSYAFASCAKLTNVTLNENLRVVGDYAFSNCTSLKELVIPDSVTWIGDSAFELCEELRNITLGQGVKWIGAKAFQDCTSLLSIAIPDSVISMGYSTFYRCDELQSVTIGNGLAEIPKRAFAECHKMMELTIGENVQVIGSHAFYWCSGLTELTLPDSVTTIENSAFFDCTSVTKLTIGPNVTSFGGSVFGVFHNFKSKLTDIYISDLSSWLNNDYGQHLAGANDLEKKLYLNGELLTDLVIPEGATRIGDKAFYCCTSLTSVTIPKGFAGIGDYAFSNCTAVTSVAMGEGVTGIGSNAFSNCTALKSIEIPASVTHVDYNAFNNSDALEAVYISDLGAWCRINFEEAIRYGDEWDPITDTIDLYLNDQLLTDLVIPEDITVIGNNTFFGFSFQTVTIPDHVTQIGDYAFRCCLDMEEITVGSGLTSLGWNVFSDCTGLKAVYVDDLRAWCGIDFMHQENNPLYYAHNLYQNGELVTELVIPEGVTTISDYAFCGASGLTQVTISGDVTSIGKGCFLDCSGLTEFVIPANVTSVGYEALSGCNSMVSLTLPFAGGSCMDNLFGSSSYYDDGYNIPASLKTVILLDGCTEIGNNAFAGCTGITSIVIPDSVTAIGECAFRNCSGLTSVTIPEGVPAIESSTFINCTALTSVTIPQSVTEVGYMAFAYCDSLWHVLYTGTEEQWNVNSLGNGVYSAAEDFTVHFNCNGNEIADLENKICTLCCAHSYGDAVTVEPTCGERGYAARTCSLCGHVHKENFTEPTGDHNYQSETTDPTCTEQGYTAHVCSVCGDSYVDTYVPANGHVDVWVTDLEPTCTELGRKTWYCAVCGESETYILSATGHAYKSHHTDATCTEGGYTTHTCTNCGDTYTDEYESALGHSFGDWVPVDEEDHKKVCSVCGNEEAGGHHWDAVVTEPTCTADGYTTHTCVDCGYSYVSDPVPAGHSYGEWHVVTGATCTEDGLQQHDCIACGYSETQVIPATGHAYKSTRTEATCTEGGYTTHVCTNCGDTYTDDYADALGHAYGEYTPETGATCTEDATESATCGNCGGTDTRPVEGTATGHVYVDGVCTDCHQPERELGDVNGDGAVDIFDANLAASYYNEVVELDAIQLQAADVNGDGAVDIFDANLIAAYYNEVIDAFPVS